MRISPTFSVIIPTRDRHLLLDECLSQFGPGAQATPHANFEVIVTDDSPSASARSLVESTYPWARWIAGPACGPAANRNHGASVATGDVLVFIDDDCKPEHTLLAAYTAALSADTSVYEGRITCREGIHSPRETSPINLHGGVLWSCNFAVQRTAFTEVGGFDERFPLPHMEDTDLRLRLLAHGKTIVFVAGASVDHPPRRLAWGSRLARIHQATVLFMLLHPPVRGLAWFLQNQLRARLSNVIHRPLSIDSLSALASIPVELGTIALRWRGWHTWAQRTAQRPR